MTQVMVLGTKGGLSTEHGLLGRTGGYQSHEFLFLFLRLGKGGKEGLCEFVGVLRVFGILMKT